MIFRMKKLFLLLCFAMCMFGLFAQTENSEKPVIVITPVDLYDVDEKSGDLVFRRMQSEFANTYKFKVVDRGALSKILKEKEFQDNSEWSSPEKIAKLKEAFNAQYIVTSVVEAYEGTLYVTMNIIDVNTTQIIASENSSIKNVQELMNGKLKTLVVRVSSKVQTDTKNISYMYIIGERGPGGGIVFYYSEEGFPVYKADGSSETYHYLECSQESLGRVTWCTYKTEKIGYCCESISPYTEIGYGKLNTNRIITTKHSHGTITSSNCAALLCAKYSTSTTKEGDWWLPSKNELNLIFENLKKQGYMNDPSYFWSSSATGKVRAWMQNFSDGWCDNAVKSDTCSVRAIRAFNN